MPEREALARDHALPVEMLMAVSETYVNMAERITGQPLSIAQDPRAEILDVLNADFALIE